MAGGGFRGTGGEGGGNHWVTPHPMRHSFATHLLEAGAGYPHGAAIVGCSDVNTTRVYTHVLNQGPLGKVRVKVKASCLRCGVEID